MSKRTLHILLLAVTLLVTFHVLQSSARNLLGEAVAGEGTHFEKATLFKKVQTGIAQNRGITGAKFEIDQQGIRKLRDDKPGLMTLEIPDHFGSLHSARLQRCEITLPTFHVGLLGETAAEAFLSDAGLHYRGVLEDDPTSMVTISVFGDEISGMMTSVNGRSELVTDQVTGRHCLVYDAKSLPSKSGFECTAVSPPSGLKNSVNTSTESRSCKIVSVNFECDYRFYLDKGSNVQSLSAYVLSFFNQVAAIYRNEEIDLRIAAINVWTTPDPYAAYGSASEVLTAFRQNTGSTFDGTLAHFLTTRNIGGGMSYLDVLCIRSYAHGVSYVQPVTNGTPSYSWTVEVVAHEIGHNFGAHHTQWCGWELENGTTGALDNCYGTEGGCPAGPAPVNGGTIMSYCHLTNHGINFSNGFGNKPGDILRNRLAVSGCILPSGEAPNGLTAGEITSVSALLSWNTIQSATACNIRYRRQGAADWINVGTSVSGSFRLTGLTPSSVYEWQVGTDCSANSDNAIFSTASGLACTPPHGVLAQPGKNGEASISWKPQGGSAPYAIRYRITGAQQWNTLEGIQETHCSVNGLTPSSEYEFQVRNSCSGFSEGCRITIQNPSCPFPGGATNTGMTRNSVTLNWNATIGAVNYTIRYRKSGTEQWTVIGPRSQTQLNLTGLSAGSTYEWKVKSNCSGYCGVQTFTTAEAAPMPVASISGEPVQLYPNPASSKFEIRFDGGTLNAQPAGMILSDMVGKVILERGFNAGENRLEVEIADLPDGIYIIQVTDDLGKSYKKRLIKR